MEQIDATLSNVSASASSVTVLAANPLRCGASIHNDSVAVLYLKMGSTASATSYTVKMEPGDHYELPIVIGGTQRAVYSGIITGIWASATGAARVTEYT